MTSEQFASELPAQRERLGITRQQAAKLCKVSYRSILSWETMEETAKLVTREGIIAILKKIKPKK